MKPTSCRLKWIKKKKSKKPKDSFHLPEISAKISLVKHLLFLLVFSLVSLHAETPVSKSINEFAFKLNTQLKARKGNLLFSPSSLHQGLSLLMVGSRNKSLEELSSLLFLNKDFSFSKDYRELITYWNSPEHPYQILSANALWGQKGMSIQADYSKIIKDDFLSSLNEVDFNKAPDKSRDAINAWVEKQTNKKIKDLLSPESVTPETKLILTNAVYFKSAWLNIFNKDRTEREKFTKTKKTTLSVPMMKNEGTYNFLTHSQFDLLELPYRGQDTAMDIILPRYKYGLNELEKSFNEENFSKWISEMKFERVEITLPRFTFKSYFQMKDVLLALGLNNCFSGESDYSGIAKEKLLLSDVIHKTFIHVDEYGTEAAAATATMMFGATLDTKKPKTFKADHPFLFVIRDTEKNAILFMGRMDDPSI